MADGFETNRSEEYFYGGMKPRPVPRRLNDNKKERALPPQCTERSASAHEDSPEKA